MVTIIKFITALFLGSMLLTSCDSTPTLQEYLVEKQEDNNFVKVDLATSLLYAEADKLTVEQKDILKTLKKINVVAFPIHDNEATYIEEKKKVQSILSQEQYQTLTTLKYKGWGLSIKYLGEDEAIDEMIVFGSDREKGFAVFRLLGENMKPEDMIRMVETMDKDNVNLAAFDGIKALF
ncbi:hypothetical protein SCB49_10697 [unidentified eubacterium SCB49]|nr:hypothetical protein SCB49_10697 [unidentified eubacterium SCB49]